MSLSMYTKREPVKVQRRTISRGGGRKSHVESVQSKLAERGASTGSDSEDGRAALRSADLDSVAVDIFDDQGWDTDLDRDDTPPPFDHSGKSAYLEECRRLGVVPASFFLRHMHDSQLLMKHHGLGASGMRAMTPAMMSNTTVVKLDLTDNWLGYEGGLAVCGMLKENCFITDLNLSDNRLQHCASELCRILVHNDTLRRVTLAGNGFDDNSAAYFAELITTTSRIEYLDLSHNLLCEVAGTLLGPAIAENESIKELDLSWNHLRRRGAIAVVTGVRNNVSLKRINLSWNGMGLEGAIALSAALKDNSVLEELDIMNNRINTEGAVLIGKGLIVNETLRVLKMGKNPMQSAGCWGICAAILKNPNCVLSQLDFSDILVNQDFQVIFQQVKEQLPDIRMTHGGTVAPLKPKAPVHPMVKLMTYVDKKKLNLVDFFKTPDQDGSMTISHQQFRQILQDVGIPLAEEEVDRLLQEMDADGKGEIHYRDLVQGHTDLQEREKERKVNVVTKLRPLTS